MTERSENALDGSSKRVYKIFCEYDYEKEEQWLNEMSDEGWQLSASDGVLRYDFEKGEEGEYLYRLELLHDDPGSEEGRKQIAFLESGGAEVICVSSGWVYLRKKAFEGEFKEISGPGEKIRYFGFIRSTFFILAIMIAITIIITLSATFGFLLSGDTFGTVLFILAALLLIPDGYAVITAVRFNNRIHKIKQDYLGDD